MDNEDPFALNGAEMVFSLDSDCLGTVTVNGQDVSKMITRVHIFLSAGHQPTMRMEMMGFECDITASLVNATLRWPKEKE